MKRDNIIDNIGKVPPQAIDLEESVLGSVMVEKDALSEVLEILKPECFYKEVNQLVYKAIITLATKSDPVDILTVVNELKRTKELDLVGGAYYVSALTNRSALTTNVIKHARIVYQKHISRELISLANKMAADAYEDSDDVFDQLDSAEDQLFKISNDIGSGESSHIGEIMKDVMKNVDEAVRNDSPITGVPSGLPALDRVLGGFQKTDLVILAATSAAS
jgi:replicative DNA helicase